MEQITGPVHGYWLACYTVPSEQGHYAYAKLCIAAPDDVWEANFAVHKVGAGPCPDPAEAIRLLVERTTSRLARKAAQPSDWMILLESNPTAR
jgi:hypothetical protein